MNGDEVRNTTFATCPGPGYDRAEVDDLLRRVAAELDAGRPAGPLIENATFQARTVRGRYDIDAVDWFLDQLRLPPGDFELAGISSDPWRDLAVASVITRRRAATSTGGLHGNTLAEDCAHAWRDFGQLPGTHLGWGFAGMARRELRTAEGHAIASSRVPSKTIDSGGRSFTWRTLKPRAWSPAIDEIAACSWQDKFGHFERPQNGRAGVRELVDETGTPILYTSGENATLRAWARVSFPDQRWLRFLVRGTWRKHAIMTAVDQAGNKVARYRLIDRGVKLRWKSLILGRASVEVTVNPVCELTNELVLAIATSAPWLSQYFSGAGVARS